MKKFDIWVEGYITNGSRGGASFIGSIEADSFREAVLEWYRIHATNYFDPERLTHYGCRHFETEREASLSFG